MAALAAVVVAGSATGTTTATQLWESLDRCMPNVLRLQVDRLLRLYSKAYCEQDTLQHSHVLKEKYDELTWSSVALWITPNEINARVHQKLSLLMKGGLSTEGTVDRGVVKDPAAFSNDGKTFKDSQHSDEVIAMES